MKISRKCLIGLCGVTSLLVSTSVVSITNKVRNESFSLVAKNNIDMFSNPSEIDVNENNCLDQDTEDVLKKSDHSLIAFKKKLDECKKILVKMGDDLVASYLVQLGDENYHDWGNFVKQFDNVNWKQEGKNKSIIEKIADLLECSFDEVNAKKIDQLDEKVKSDVQKMLSKKQEALNSQKQQFERIKKDLSDFLSNPSNDEYCINLKKSIAQLSISNKSHKGGLVVNKPDTTLSCSNNQLNTTHKVNALDEKKSLNKWKVNKQNLKTIKEKNGSKQLEHKKENQATLKLKSFLDKVNKK